MIPRPRRMAAALLLLVALVAAGVSVGRRSRVRRSAAAPPAGARAPDSVRIRVEVLNATRIDGLARQATLYLRDRGFDVVEFGTAGEQRDSTLVLDRSGRPEWARLVARAMDGASMQSRPDSSRYVDVTVLVGRSWRPPAQPFYP